MKLAIKGHRTRGKEVIQLLEMLGGVNIFNLDGTADMYCYYIDDNDHKIHLNCLPSNNENAIVFTLEEFEKLYPYKVGDKVIFGDIDNIVWEIESMQWVNNEIKYIIRDNNKSRLCDIKAEHLQPYKEETNMKTDCKKCGLHYGSVRCFDMDYCPNNKPKSNAVGLKDGKVIECEVNKEPDMVEDNYCETLETKVFGYKVGDVIFTNNTGWIRITNKLWDCYAKEHTYEGIGWINEQEYDNISHKDITGKIELDKVTDKNNCDINCPDGYEFYDDNGNLIGNKIIMRQKKPTYPKTYKECCNILGIEDRENGYCGYEYELLGEFQQLYICRNAYWKIAGEQMGLGEPWEPDWCNENKLKYCIECSFGTIDKTVSIVNGCFLAFPTKEMRDVFFDNFKDLIEQCKELL